MLKTKAQNLQTVPYVEINIPESGTKLPLSLSDFRKDVIVPPQNIHQVPMEENLYKEILERLKKMGLDTRKLILTPQI